MKLVKNWLFMILLLCGAIELSMYAAANKLPEAAALGALLAEEQKQRKEQEALQEEEIKEGAEEQKLPEKRIQLLMTFLDNKEAFPGNNVFPVTQTLVAALFNKAGPIITTASLLYNIMDGPFAQSKEGSSHRKVVEEFKRFFKEEEWIIKIVASGLLLMVPKSYLEEQNVTLDDIGLQYLSNVITLAGLRAVYSRASPLQWGNAGDIFADALLANNIFNESSRTIKWVMYFCGHGVYGAYIAGISLNKFSQILDYCNNYEAIAVALFIYQSCYAAGFNAAQVYGELKKAAYPKEYLSTGQPRFSPEYLASGVKEYRFPIVTAAIADATARGLPFSMNYDGSLKINIDFKQFMQEFTIFEQDKAENFARFSSQLSAMHFYKTVYGKMLALIMPDVGYAGNLPQMRYAYSPAWFPVPLPTLGYQEETKVVRINDTMAFTRMTPLVVGSFKHKKYLTAVLLDTDYIPFEIVLTERGIVPKEYAQQPYIIITLSGDVEVYCEKITTQRTPLITLFPVDMKLDFFAVKPFYEGNKRIYIKELVLDIKDMPTEIYTNAVIDFAQKRFYYTDAQGKQFVVYKDENGMVEPHEYFDNYEMLYPDPLFTNKSIMDKAATRREMQKIGFVEAAKYKRKAREDKSLE